uniref:Low-density lipoprotein receptor class A domain-containing protein 2 n=1 Tax=Pogona vitticeps TaxID=103695 RepID=A0ABM5EK77_9SAUR
MGRGSRLQAWAKWLLLLNMQVFPASAMQTVSMVDFCGKTLHGDGMVLTSHRDSRRYYFVVPDTDCQLTLQAASPKDQVQFQFRFFLVYSMLRSPSSTPPSTPQDHRVPASPREPLGGPCSTGSYLQFYDGSDQMAKSLGAPLCGKTIPRPVLSTGPFLTLRLLTRGQQPRVDFVGHFTSLRTGLNASACRAELYFPCRNGKCIPPFLVCDGGMVDDCGDGTDQPAQPPAWCEGSPTLLPVLPSEAAPAVSVWPTQATRTGQQETPLPPPGVRTWDQTGKCKLLLASLAAVLGVVLLFWCCWNPGWFVWRVGACRHLRGCNSVCAACHLCTRSCTQRATAKVTPHGTTEPPV